MKKAKILLCDMDGVLADFSKAYSTILAKLTGSGLIVSETNKSAIQAWDWVNWYPGATRAIINNAWAKIRFTDNFWEKLDIIDSQGLDSLFYLKDKFDIYFVTSRIPTRGASVMTQTQNWLVKHGFSNPNVIVTGQKNALAAVMRAHILIDDKAEYFEPTAVDANLEWEHLALINSSHNQNSIIHKDVKRYESLTEVTNMLLKEVS